MVDRLRAFVLYRITQIGRDTATMAEHGALAEAPINREAVATDDTVNSNGGALLVARRRVGTEAAGRPATMVDDELASVVSVVCAKFPGHPRGEIEILVTDVYRHLKKGAKVTAHLIPLTLNRSLRLMREAADSLRANL